MNDDIVSLVKAIESIPWRICIGINSTLSVIEWVDKSIDKLNGTIENYSKSTEKLSRNTFWLNVAITISALIWAIKVWFDIYIYFSTK